jgi:hypothetical protein
MKLRILFAVMGLSLIGCGENRYHLIYGPAEFDLSPTPWGSPGLSIQIEKDGVIWLGPDKPNAAELGFIGNGNGYEEEEEVMAEELETPPAPAEPSQPPQ